MQETVYEHASGNSTFTVTADERWSKNMILRLKERFPEEVEILSVSGDGVIVAHVPYSWMRIVPKRRVDMTEEQKASAAERMRRAREGK